jgi:hypothetical protein
MSKLESCSIETYVVLLADMTSHRTSCGSTHTVSHELWSTRASFTPLLLELYNDYFKQPVFYLKVPILVSFEPPPYFFKLLSNYSLLTKSTNSKQSWNPESSHWHWLTDYIHGNPLQIVSCFKYPGSDLWSGGLVVRVPGCGSRGLGLISSTTRFSEK